MSIQSKATRIGLLTAVLGCFSSGAMASVVFDLTGDGNQGDPGWGNDLDFSASGISVNVAGFGATGTSDGSTYNGDFETAEVYSWGTGIGVCNRDEGTQGSGCSDAEHEVDASYADDMVVFVFDQQVIFENITIDPYNGSGDDPNGRDLRYWIADVATTPDFTSENFPSLDALLGTSSLSTASPSYYPFSHSLSGVGNILVISGDYTEPCTLAQNTAGSCDAYKIKNLSVAPIPVPGAVWLFGSAILGLVAARNRNS